MNKPVKKIPTLEDIKGGKVERSELQKLLDSEPPTEWLKKHPTARNERNEPVMYLPIDKIDQLLTDIYAGHWTDINHVETSPNSISVTVRLFVVNPENGRVEHVDGIGAFSNRIGIESAAPMAESLAKKNAAKKLGKLFGRDLSRDFEGMEKPEPKKEPEPKKTTKSNPVKDRIVKQIEVSKTAKSLKNVISAIKLRVEQKQLSEAEMLELIDVIEERAINLGLKM